MGALGTSGVISGWPPNRVSAASTNDSSDASSAAPPSGTFLRTRASVSPTHAHARPPCAPLASAHRLTGESEAPHRRSVRTLAGPAAARAAPPSLLLPSFESCPQSSSTGAPRSSRSGPRHLRISRIPSHRTRNVTSEAHVDHSSIAPGNLSGLWAASARYCKGWQRWRQRWRMQ